MRFIMILAALIAIVISTFVIFKYRGATFPIILGWLLAGLMIASYTALENL